MGTDAKTKNELKDEVDKRAAESTKLLGKKISDLREEAANVDKKDTAEMENQLTKLVGELHSKIKRGELLSEADLLPIEKISRDIYHTSDAVREKAGIRLAQLREIISLPTPKAFQVLKRMELSRKMKKLLK